MFANSRLTQGDGDARVVAVAEGGDQALGRLAHGAVGDLLRKLVTLTERLAHDLLGVVVVLWEDQSLGGVAAAGVDFWERACPSRQARRQAVGIARGLDFDAGQCRARLLGFDDAGCFAVDIDEVVGVAVDGVALSPALSNERKGGARSNFSSRLSGPTMGEGVVPPFASLCLAFTRERRGSTKRKLADRNTARCVNISLLVVDDAPPC